MITDHKERKGISERKGKAGDHETTKNVQGFGRIAVIEASIGIINLGEEKEG